MESHVDSLPQHAESPIHLVGEIAYGARIKSDCGRGRFGQLNCRGGSGSSGIKFAEDGSIE